MTKRWTRNRVKYTQCQASSRTVTRSTQHCSSIPFNPSPNWAIARNQERSYEMRAFWGRPLITWGHWRVGRLGRNIRNKQKEEWNRAVSKYSLTFLCWNWTGGAGQIKERKCSVSSEPLLATNVMFSYEWARFGYQIALNANASRR